MRRKKTNVVPSSEAESIWIIRRGTVIASATPQEEVRQLDNAVTGARSCNEERVGGDAVSPVESFGEASPKQDKREEAA